MSETLSMNEFVQAIKEGKHKTWNPQWRAFAEYAVVYHDTLKSQLASSQERIEKLEGALRRISRDAEQLGKILNSHTALAIKNTANEALNEDSL